MNPGVVGEVVVHEDVVGEAIVGGAIVDGGLAASRRAPAGVSEMATEPDELISNEIAAALAASGKSQIPNRSVSPNA